MNTSSGVRRTTNIFRENKISKLDIDRRPAENLGSLRPSYGLSQMFMSFGQLRSMLIRILPAAIFVVICANDTQGSIIYSGSDGETSAMSATNPIQSAQKEATPEIVKQGSTRESMIPASVVTFVATSAAMTYQLSEIAGTELSRRFELYLDTWLPEPPLDGIFHPPRSS